MNKIYNNLNIDNLMKTEEYKYFNKEQKEEIRLGLEKNLDVSVYAKLEYNWKQMYLIREGLENNLDVSIYAKEEFTFSQMEQIKYGLEDGLDVSIYTKKDFCSYQMNKIRKVLEKNRIKAVVYAKITYFLNKINLNFLEETKLC